MRGLAVHFSSRTDEWSTPWSLFRELDREFHFTLDVCATTENAKCACYFTKTQDGLVQEWEGVCWMNPPYGSQIGRWINKAYDSSLRGATVVCLVPSRTDTEWWHRWAMKGEIRFIRKRVRFNNGRDGAPFPSAIVIFRPPSIDVDTPPTQAALPLEVP